MNDKLELENLTLFKSPIKTMKLFIIELFIYFKNLILNILNHTILSFTIFLIIIALVSLKFINGEHQELIQYYEEDIYSHIQWITLGILSSVGLGTGLHTFVLYLGPFIAKVTLAATECNSINFDIRGENAFICKDDSNDLPVTFWMIVFKVQLAALMWGFGTAIGELPPYFVARAGNY